MQTPCAPKDRLAPSVEWKTERLHSWKEIACFFQREVRTVQLWEKSEGLPVRRQHHKKLGSVFAYRCELEAWWMGRSTPSPSARLSPDVQAAQHHQQQHTKRVWPVPLHDAAEHPPAYHACMLGLHFWKQRTRTDLLRALACFHDAILIDPTSAEAYAGLTDAYVSLSYNHLMPAREAIKAAQRAIATGLRLDPASIAVRNAEINFRTNCTWDWQSAQRACEQIVDTGHINARTLQLYAALMINLGRHDEAISLALHGHRLDPYSDSANSEVSFAYFYAGDYDSAISFIERTIALKPLFHVGHALLGRTEAQRGNWDQAIASFEQGLAISNGSNFLKALLAYGHAGRGDEPAANGLLREIEAQHDDACFPAVDVSAVHAMLRQQDKAIENISRAFELRDMKVAYIKHDPRFTDLRALPQFGRITASVCAFAS